MTDMAAVILKVVRATRNQNVYATCYTVQSHDYSSKPNIIKNPTTASLKRGTGGRSSFSGKICTVFGCSGFIGSYLPIILPHRCDPYRVRQLKVGGDLGQVLYHPFDLRDEESIIKCMKYSNVVINLIGRNTETNNFSFKDVHVEGARKLARLAKQCNVERFIHMSCLNAAKKPTVEGSKILQTKWEGELAVKEEFPEATIIRPSAIYGQRDKFISHYCNESRKIYRSYVALYDKGEKTEKQPIHIRDVVSGIVAIINNPNTAGKTYQFVGPKRYKLSELVSWMFDIAYPFQKIEILELRNNVITKLKVAFWETVLPVHPVVDLTWEVIECHHTTDKIDPTLPTLEDLGIAPIEMESIFHYEVNTYAEDRADARNLDKMKSATLKTILK
ncbi:NADH dehydrogenase [ubiquinone] 1 alpha subcomplex subunit 9, mitochondrial [Habropoda laboriosa]|uniref:NADH dehydrogenase [ubiquinone] 1 alpha subcomplex subunit 9, mitochondrial n=1 Tax=Habropoda laboriosa TaxID=597456 RepID=A0A0L7R0P1_9HYME|nr:NADH dehydrogenase [ubiquinone] 1 alpha subcomplex subunit 9, mitochondrial [Habropoda laboriosa]